MIKKAVNICLLLVLVILVKSTFAQDSLDTWVAQPFVSKRQVSIEIGTFLYNPLQIQTQGTEVLFSKPNLSPNVKASMGFSLHKNLGVMVGAHIGSAAYNYRFDIEIPADHPLAGHNLALTHREYDVLIFGFDTEIRYKFKLSKNSSKHKFLIAGGVRHQAMKDYSSALSFTAHKKDTYDVNLFQMEMNREGGKHFFTFSSKIGMIKNLNQQNSLEFCLVGNFLSRTISSGNFDFYNVPSKSSGTLNLKGNFIGFSFVYTFAIYKPNYN